MAMAQAVWLHDQAISSPSAREVRFHQRRPYEELLTDEAPAFRDELLGLQSRCPQGHKLQQCGNKALSTDRASKCTICSEATGGTMYSCGRELCRFRLCVDCAALSEEAFVEKAARHRCDRGHVLQKLISGGWGMCAVCHQGSDDYMCGELCLFDMCSRCTSQAPHAAYERRRDRLQIQYKLPEEFDTQENDAKVAIERAATTLIGDVVGGIDMLCVLRGISLFWTWVFAWLGCGVLSCVVIICSLSLSMMHERSMVENMRATAEAFRDRNSTCSWPWQTRVMHPNAVAKLRYFMRDRKALFDGCGPVVPYWVFDFFLLPHFSVLEYADVYLQSFVAGAAFHAWPGVSEAKFARQWEQLPGIGGVMAWVGLPRALTCIVLASTVSTGVQYLWKRKEHADHVGKLFGLADVSGLGLVAQAAAYMSVPMIRLKRAATKYISRTVANDIPSLFFTVTWLALTAGKQRGLNVVVGLLSVVACNWHILRSAYDLAPPQRGPKILLIWLPIFSMLLLSLVRCIGIVGCLTHVLTWDCPEFF